MNAAEAARFRSVLDQVAAKPIPDLTAALVALTNTALVAARAMVDLAETLHRADERMRQA
jgi:hypothetical protein